MIQMDDTFSALLIWWVLWYTYSKLGIIHRLFGCSVTIALIRQKPKRLTYLIVHFAKNWWSTTTFRKESQSLKVNLPWSVCLSYKKCQNYWGIQNGTEKVSSITSKFNILAIGENWCIDSIINIPVVHWLEKTMKI